MGICNMEKTDGVKKRIGIHVFYNEDGLVKSFHEFLLDSICPIMDKLIITVNGDLKSEGKKILEKYTKNIYYRKNIGFDGGAYKDTILEFLKDEEWEKYDELVLFNDTFYGPFCPMKEIFYEMEKEDVDFWGLSRWPENKSIYVSSYKNLPTHIQSYFVVINRQMFLSNLFFDFFSKISYPRSHAEAVEDFEIKFSTFFMEAGFQCTSWIDWYNENNEQGITVETDEKASYLYDINFPILKRRAICGLNDKEIEKVYECIKKTSGFPIVSMKKDRDEMLRNGKCLPFSIDTLQRFIEQKKRIYIYGNGIYKNVVVGYMRENGYLYEGIVVSKKMKKEKELIEFSELTLSQEDGLIIALGYKNAKEVYEKVTDKFNADLVLFPQNIY